MRTCLGWALVQALVCAVGVSGFSLSDLISDLVPLKITTGSTAQNFEGWGTSLAWFAEYIGCLEGAYSPLNCLTASLLGQELYTWRMKTSAQNDHQLAMKHIRRVVYVCPDESGMPCRFSAGESG